MSASDSAVSTRGVNLDAIGQTAGDNGTTGRRGMRGIGESHGRAGGDIWAIREIAVANRDEEERSALAFLWQMGCETHLAQGGLVVGWSTSQKPQWPLECVHLSSPTHPQRLQPGTEPPWDDFPQHSLNCGHFLTLQKYEDKLSETRR